MKKLLVLLAILSICNHADAKIKNVYMSRDLIMSSLDLTQEQWTDKCALERLRMYSSVYGCLEPTRCPALVYTLKRHCWPQYDVVRRGAYLRK